MLKKNQNNKNTESNDAIESSAPLEFSGGLLVEGRRERVAVNRK